MKKSKLLWQILGYVLIPALFFGLGNSLRAQDTYKKITSIEELTDGLYLIGNTDGTKVLGPQGKNNRTAVEVTSSAGTITTVAATDSLDSKPFEIHIVKTSSGNYTLMDNVSKLYLTNTDVAGKNNYLKLVDTEVEYTIGLSATADTIKMAGVTGRNWIRFNSSSSIFACYASGQNDVALYKKQEKPCEPVTNVLENITATSVTLSWTAPANAPANGYQVTLKDEDENEVDKTTVTGTTYSKDQLTAKTIYTYEIVSLCSATSSSTAVEGIFETLDASAKSLAVSLSGGEKEGEIYTTVAPITFTFETTNAAIGTDSKVKIYIVDGEGEEAVDSVADQASIDLLFVPGDYDAEFELVDREGNSLDPVVKGNDLSFSVKLPTVKAPEFSHVDKDTVYTTAQTITLSSETQDASFFYAINEGEFAAYSNGIVLNQRGTFTVRAFAVKTGMENSDTVSKTYKIKVPRVLEPGVLFYEPFDDVEGFNTSQDLFDNTKVDIDKYTELPGWTGTKVYSQYAGSVKLGTSSAKGELQTPAIDMSANGGAFVLSFNAQAWKTSKSDEVNKILLTVGDSVLTVTIDNTIDNTAAQNGTMPRFEYRFANGTSETKIKFEGTTDKNNRFFLDNIMIKEAEICHDVEEVACEHTGSTAVISWVVEHTPALGYAIEVRQADNTLVKQDTVKDPATHTYTLENLADGEYNYSVTALCSADLVSEPVGDHFEIVPAGQPAISIVKPAAGEFKRDSVMFTCKVTNFVLGTGEDAEGSIKYTLSGTNLTAPVTGTITDTFFYHKFERSGKDTVRLELVDKTGAPLTPAKVVRRAFTINLPDVAAPVFTPAEISHNNAIEVSISCDTVGASIYYSLNKGEYTLYTAPIAINKTGTYEFKAYAAKAKMDTSRVVSKTYTVKMPSAAKPVFTPSATFHRDSIKVAMKCDTVGASIYYSLNDAAYTLYTDSIKLNATGIYAFKAVAVKAGLDNSDTVSKTYTIKFTEPLEPGVLFYEPFDGFVYENYYDISANLDDKTILPGWTGAKLYIDEGKDGMVRVAAASAVGEIETPAIDLSANNGQFILTFDAMAYNNAKDQDNFKLVVNGEEKEVSGLTKTEMTSFEYVFSNGTANTTIKFASAQASNNRFYLDNVKVQELSDDPAFNVASSLTMSTVQGTPVSKTVTVTGRNLTEDITVSCPEGNFSVEPATLPKETVMGENGAELTITFNGNEASDNVSITLAHGELTKTIEVSATATTAQEVENLAALREKDADESTVYQVKGQVVVTAVDGNSVWAQDATAAILIYGATGQQYKVGDGITGIYGKLKNYNDLIELLPSGNQPAAGSHDNVVEPEVMTVEALNEAGAEYSSRLVRINGLFLDSTGVWAASKNYVATDKDGNGITIRTTIAKGSYINETLPADTFDLIAVVGIYNGTVQVSPRVKEDIIVAGGDEPGTANEVADELACRLYPNPTTGMFYVEVAESARMEIFTLGGVMVRNEMLSAGKTEIRLDQSGLYFIRLTNGNAAAVRRVVVR